MKAEKFGSVWYSSPGLVYFVGAGSPTVAIKIGVANRVGFLRRLRSIQGSNHELVELLGVVLFDTMRLAEIQEQEWHRKFVHLQRLKNGHVGHEWFTATPELLAFLKSSSVEPEQLGLQRHVSVRPQADA
jgi:hypothetical protein